METTNEKHDLERYGSTLQRLGFVRKADGPKDTPILTERQKRLLLRSGFSVHEMNRRRYVLDCPRRNVMIFDDCGSLSVLHCDYIAIRKSTFYELVLGMILCDEGTEAGVYTRKAGHEILRHLIEEEA